MANKASVWAGRSLSLLLLLGCNVAPPPGSTGGVTKQSDGSGRGLSIVNTDYQPTNVSLLDIEGAVLERFWRSARGDPAGRGPTETGSPGVCLRGLATGAGPDLL